MTNKIDNLNGCTFQWKIENISNCWKKIIESIDSPKFIADALEGTEWSLSLYPSERLINQESIVFCLRKEMNGIGPEVLRVNFEISILDKDGTFLQGGIQSNCCYCQRFSCRFADFSERQKVFVSQREAYLPEDTLMLQCTIWNTDQKPSKTEHLFGRTTLSLNRRNFQCRIEDFSSLKCDSKHTFKDGLIEFDLVLKEGIDLEKKLILNINSFAISIKYFSFKASIVDSEGEKESCGSQEYFQDDLINGVLYNVLFAKKFMEHSWRYLPNDVLTLDCEYTYSDGTVLYEHCGFGNIKPKLTNEWMESRNEGSHQIEKEKSETLEVMEKDFLSMYSDQIFSDVEIRTSTQTFPAHKNILSARSPVFRKMLSNEMKEKISGHVDINDLEDDTVQLMLLYMYTGTLNDLQYENAYKLYMAAYKYEILSLKNSCSTFMKNNLCPKKACDVLALADRYQDDDLKKTVQDFILKYNKAIFCSQEWKDFISTNSKIAADMMYLFTLSNYK